MTYDPYECPDCDAHRDSPTAACDRCGYDPNPAPADDRALDAWERKIAEDAASLPGQVTP